MRKRFRHEIDILDLLEWLDERGGELNTYRKVDDYIQQRLEDAKNKDKDKKKDEKKPKMFSGLEVFGMIMLFGPPIVLLEAWVLTQIPGLFK